MKLWKRVIERRLRKETSVSENQFGFMPRRSLIEAIHLIRSLMENFRERQRDLHLAFIDLEKTYDSVPRLNNRLENWREALKDNNLRVSREKTEYLRWDFGNMEIAHNEEICIGDKILQPKESFRYLGSMMHKSGRIDEDVAHLIKATWLKWRAATRILYDRNGTLKLKGKFYRVAIRPAMLYGLECWPITKALANRMEVAELRMLRWMCGKTMLDMIPNGVYRAELEVDSIINKMRRKGRPKLRWEDRVKLDMKELLLS
ncbi:hypothetical protein Tco_1040712 [Tanacetum coccineum]